MSIKYGQKNPPRKFPTIVVVVVVVVVVVIVKQISRKISLECLLVAASHLYRRLCPPVRTFVCPSDSPFVRPYVSMSVRNAFS